MSDTTETLPPCTFQVDDRLRVIDNEWTRIAGEAGKCVTVARLLPAPGGDGNRKAVLCHDDEGQIVFLMDRHFEKIGELFA